jgi:hypothetical protein
MTDSDVRVGTWKPVPGAGYYEVCDHGGLVRSVNRTINGRPVAGKTLTPKISGTSPYWQVKYTDDGKRVRTRPVGVLVLEAHVGPCPRGKQCCHDDDDLNNNDLSNLRWDWPPANKIDRELNHPAPPKPPKVCIRCGEEFTGNGRRCLPCQKSIGAEAAKLLTAGVVPSKVAVMVDYPSIDGLFNLARKHGGYGQSRSRRVRQRLARLIAGGDAQ